MQLEDNANNVQSYSAGQVVDFHVDIEARHTGKAVSYMDVDLKNLTNNDDVSLCRTSPSSIW